MTVTYFHPAKDEQGKFLSSANIIWAQRNCGSAYYRTSIYAMKNGRFPANHPCAPFDDATSDGGQMGNSEALKKFRSLGYWASCFPEGDGITLDWWSNVEPTVKTTQQVMQDIKDCFGWEVVHGNPDSLEGGMVP